MNHAEPSMLALPDGAEFVRVQAGALEIGALLWGEPGARPIVLLHGFPYDVAAYHEVAPRLAKAGRRVIVPWLRGYGPTRFRHPDTLRSGQQAALAHDLLSLMDTLGIESATLAGYDWGGRAACIVAALWPNRVRGLVTCNGYNIQDIARADRPLAPEDERGFWYQYYFHSERGRNGLAQHGRALCELLWRTWSPEWRFDAASFECSAASFSNPDFVDVVIHSYRHRFGLVAGDPAYDSIEAALATQPPIPVPVIHIDGEADGVLPGGHTRGHRRHFGAAYEYRSLPRVGHNVPQEAPAAFADAVLKIDG